MHVNSHSPIVINSLLNQNQLILKTSVDNNEKLRLWKIIKPILAESAHAIVLNLGVLAFLATPISIPLLTVSVVTSLGLSCLSAWRDCARRQTAISKKTENLLTATHILSRASIVDTLGLSKPNILIHEGGHFLAAKALFKGSNPKIWVKPYQGGGTSYTASNRLTFLGKIFGKGGSKMVVAGAGLAASTLFICSELAVAHKIRKTHPKLSQYMNLHAICHLFHEVIYGLTAFFASKKDLGHDLVHLWTIGKIHPAIPISLLITLPLIEMLALRHMAKSHVVP